jgi:hypothetical protein
VLLLLRGSQLDSRAMTLELPSGWLRTRLTLAPPEKEQGRLVLEKPEAIKHRLLARFTGMPADRQLVDELLSERRLQAQQEGI